MGGTPAFYAVASVKLQRTLAFDLTQEEAEAAMASVTEEEPNLGTDLSIVRIDFFGTPTVETIS